MSTYIARTDPDTSALDADELAFAEAMRDHICTDHTAMSISNLSHDQVWAAANIGEEIPLAATLVASQGEITRPVKKWAESVVKRYEAGAGAG
jgi:hypothetical protein